MRILALIAAAAAFSPEDALWEQFKQEFSKSYQNAEEEAQRKAVFKKNLEFIAHHNAAQNEYQLEVNHFADQTGDEFATTHLGLKAPALDDQWAGLTHLGTHDAKEGVENPAEIDWTTKGAVTPVKNQGQCGSCWSFSTTGSLEGRAQITTGKLTSLSEQQFVDCDAVDQACNGGLMDNAFKYAEKNDICTEESYSYKAAKGSCSASSCTVGLKKGQVVGFKDVAQNEAALESAVAEGPVSVAIEADKQVFQFYKSGVLTGSCGAQLDHGVLVVGYGVEDGKKYWKVKNSWGPTWGDQGFIKLLKGKKTSWLPFLPSAGECGILKKASYPVIAKAEVALGDDKECELCTMAAELILNEAKTAASHLSADTLKQLCAKLPKQAEQEICDIAMEFAGQKIIDALNKKIDTLTSDEVCAMLKMCPAAAVADAASHYEQPPCEFDEMEAQLDDVAGILCAPRCDDQGSCPQDVPAGTKATPMCALQSGSGEKYCALVCKADADCAAGAKCGKTGAEGLCVYPKPTQFLGAAPETLTKLQKKQVVEIVFGIVRGFFIGKDPIGEACIGDAAVVTADIEEAVEDFLKKDATDVAAGLKKLADALQKLPQTLTECKKAEQDVEEVINSLKAFESPEAFAYHVGKDLIVNGKDIIHEISAAIVDWKAEQWTDFGVQVGTALREVVVGEAAEFEV